jgi:hypothetical protein
MADINNNPQSPVNGGTAAVSSAASPQQATVPGGSPSGAQQQPRPCPQDCSRCSTQQHIFCSTKMIFDLSRAFQESRRQQAEIVQAVAEIQERLKPKEQEAQLSIPFDGEA